MVELAHHQILMFFLCLVTRHQLPAGFRQYNDDRTGKREHAAVQHLKPRDRTGRTEQPAYRKNRQHDCSNAGRRSGEQSDREHRREISRERNEIGVDIAKAVAKRGCRRDA